MKSALLGVLLAAGAAAQAEEIATADGPLYIAGDRFSLEQAIADATLENLGPDGTSPFTVIAIGLESRKLTVKGTRPNVRDAVRRMQRSGGLFYVCERDVKQAGWARKDLLPGIQIEHSLSDKSSDRYSAEAPSVRRIRRLC